MKNKFSSIVFAIICGMFIASCGGGGGKKLASNDVLGNLPNLVCQYYFADSVRDAKQDAEEAKFSKNAKFNKANLEKWKKMDEKFDAEKDALKAKYDAEAEKLKSSLVGKDVPFEMEEGCGYEVSNLKITDVSKYGATVDFDVKITDATVMKIYQWGTLSFYFQVLDKDGNLIGVNYFGESRYSTIPISQKNGETGSGKTHLVSEKDAEQMVNFAKIKFIKAPKNN